MSKQKKAYPNLPAPPTKEIVEAATDLEGFTVVEKILKVKDRQGKERVLERGFVLAYNDGTTTKYCGRTTLWHNQPGWVDCPFKDRETALKVAEAQRVLWEYIETAKSKAYPTTDHVLTVPLAELNGSTRRRPSQIQWHLTAAEGIKFAAIRQAYRQLNVEISPGRPVVTDQDVLRYMFAQI